MPAAAISAWRFVGSHPFSPSQSLMVFAATMPYTDGAPARFATLATSRIESPVLSTSSTMMHEPSNVDGSENFPSRLLDLRHGALASIVHRG
jgi:hypothetical protein